MSNYGIEIRNRETGLVQIDNNYMNQAVMQSGLISSIGSYTTPYYGGRIYTLLINASIENPSLALDLSKAVWVSKTSFGVRTDGKTQVSIWVSGDPGQLKYYVFGSNIRSTLGYGLVVYDSAGKITFDSGNKYLKILGIAANSYTSFDPNNSANKDSDTSVQFDVNKYKLAILITGDPTEYMQDVIFGGGTTVTPFLVFGVIPYRISSDNRVLQTMIYVTSIEGAGGAPDNNIYRHMPHSLVIDVTNY